MADTFTAALKARKIEQGGSPGAWAAPFNNDCIELLDDAIAGTQAINLGVATSYALAALGNGADSESRAMRLRFTGTPASAVTVTVPASVTSKLYVIDNACGQPLTVKYAATAGVIVRSGDLVILFADGTNVRWIGAGYEEGTFTAQLNGVSGTATVTSYYVRNGRSVTLFINDLEGTGNATTCTISGVPVGLRPARSQGYFHPVVQNNGVYTVGLTRLDTDGSFVIFPDSVGSNASGWTASGSRSVSRFNYSYLLN